MSSSKLSFADMLKGKSAPTTATTPIVEISDQEKPAWPATSPASKSSPIKSSPKAAWKEVTVPAVSVPASTPHQSGNNISQVDKKKSVPLYNNGNNGGGRESGMSGGNAGNNGTNNNNNNNQVQKV